MLSKRSRFCDVGGLMWRIKAHVSNGAGMRCVYLCHSSKPPTKMVAAANPHYRTFASIGTLKPKPPRPNDCLQGSIWPWWYVTRSTQFCKPCWMMCGITQMRHRDPASNVWVTSQKPFKGRLAAAVVKGSIATDCSLWMKADWKWSVSSWGTDRQINNKFYLY